jgi:hypothetical protein
MSAAPKRSRFSNRPDESVSAKQQKTDENVPSWKQPSTDTSLVAISSSTSSFQKNDKPKLSREVSKTQNCNRI